MKIALLGDTHFGARNDNPAFHKHFAKFYDEIFFPTLRQRNIEYVIQLGDVFDRRKFINFNSLLQCRKYFFEPLNRDFKSWLLVGNHDTYYKNTNEVNSLQLLLNEYNNIHGITEPFETGFDGVPIIMVPWISEENNQRIHDALQSTKSTIVMGHFEIAGFEMYRGTMCENGMSAKTFDKFDLVISGHFHHKSSHGNITYVGTPYEMMWSDYGDQKGFYILDTETRELEFIRNPHNMFNKIHYDDLDKMISDVVNIDFNQYNESFVKIIVRNKTNPYCFDMFIDKLEKVGVYGVQVVDDHFHMDTETDETIISEAEDTVTILTKYVNQMSHNVDKKQLEQLMVSLYQEALHVE